MKKQSYQNITDKSIADIKIYTLAIAPARYTQEIADIVNASLDAYTLQKKLNRRKDIALAIFINIKKCLDQANTLLELEEHLIYMNILLDAHFKPVISYKYNLFRYILNKQDFTSDTYCILRHLIVFNTSTLPAFITYMVERSHLSLQRFHYLATTIYCIEQEYKRAYQHVPYIVIDEELEAYRQELLHYSSYKYYRYIEKQSNKHVVFS